MPPALTLAWITPFSGAVVSGFVSFTVTTTGPVKTVTFTANSVPAGAIWQPVVSAEHPITFTTRGQAEPAQTDVKTRRGASAGQPVANVWDSRLVADGSYVLRATAQGAKQTVTAEITIAVLNGVGPPPPPPPTPVDCQVSAWGPWLPISETIEQRTRTIFVAPAYGGRSCPVLTEARVIAVIPDTEAPTIAITAPAPAAVVSGTVNITVAATDNVTVASIVFLVNGVPISTQSFPTPQTSRTAWAVWIASGAATLTARATDAAGNTTLSAPVSVTISGAPSTLLAASDLTYLGYFLAPQTDMAFSSGIMTARRYTDGFGTNTLRFLMTNWTYTGPATGNQLIEFVYPGVGSSLTNGDAGAPQAVTIRSWPALVNRTTAQLITTAVGGAVVIRGLGYLGDLGNGPQLVIGYSANYQPQSGDPSILTTILHDDGTSTSYGPWCNRTVGPTMHGTTGLVPADVRAATGCGALWTQSKSIATAETQNGGAYVQTWDLPALATAADVPAAAFNLSGAIASQHAVGYSVTRPQPRPFINCIYETGSVGFTSCPSPWGDPDVYGAHYFGGNIPDADPTRLPHNLFGGPPNTPLDAYDTGAWIETGSKRGFLFSGQLVAWINGYAYHSGDNKNHFWYGTHQSCTSSTVNAETATTGPHAETLVNTFAIFDPRDFQDVLNGIKPANGLIGSAAPLPTSTFHGDTFPGFPLQRHEYNIGQFSALYFDPVTNLLFLSETLHTGAYTYAPAVHVFQVA